MPFECSFDWKFISPQFYRNPWMRTMLLTSPTRLRRHWAEERCFFTFSRHMPTIVLR
jgi:hypothetical protein